MQTLIVDGTFPLVSGQSLNQLEIAYHTFGKLNAEKSNVVWVCHALTANSDPTEWWPKVVGNEAEINPEEYFIVCANIIGSCYGSTGPLSTNGTTGKPYYNTFPDVTIEDIVNAHELLRLHLEISTIKIGIGGSMGGYQLVEWSALRPELFEHLILLATSAKESAWGKAIHTAQRMSIEADSTWQQEHEDAGRSGLEAARAIGMLTYRNYAQFDTTQSDDQYKKDVHRAESYVRYQGKKLANRFHAFSYYLLSKAMDNHNVFRMDEAALKCVVSKVLIIGISSDILCPPAEQKQLANAYSNAIYREIESPYGHDGFLVEWESINRCIRSFIHA